MFDCNLRFYHSPDEFLVGKFCVSCRGNIYKNDAHVGKNKICIMDVEEVFVPKYLNTSADLS
jgi:hypothetical protein